MQYGLTKNTIDRMKLKKVPNGTETDFRFIWEVNYANICGKKVLLIVHADTRYCMICTDIKPSVWRNLRDYIHELIDYVMRREGLSEEEVDRYFDLAGTEEITKTHGRKATGGMIHLTQYLNYYEKILVEGSMYQPLISDVANRDIGKLVTHPELGYVEPREFFLKAIRELLSEFDA